MTASRSPSFLRAPLALLTSALCLPLVLVAGCGSCDNTPNLTDSGTTADDDDAGTDADAGATSECRTIAIGDVGLDVQWDVETVYSAPVETTMGTAVNDYLVFNFVNYNERTGPGAAVGTFSLSEAPNDNRGTCAECISVFVDQLSENSAPSKVLFQSRGSITLETNPRTGTFRGRVEGLELAEAEIDTMTLESFFVEGGECVRIDDFDVDFKYVPPEWTCDADLYDSGGICNCECGAYDPDCWCDPFVEGDCPDVIENDCSEGDVCTYEGCRATCDIFSEPQVPCSGGGLCAFDDGRQVCIPAPGRVNAASLGETCEGLGGLVQYCDVEGSLPKGMCDDFDATCRPLCNSSSMCTVEGDVCFTVSGGPPDEGGVGYCRPEVDEGGGGDDAPAGWECPAELYGDGNVCECACGIPDPDCDDASNEVLGCEAGQTCVEGACQ